MEVQVHAFYGAGGRKAITRSCMEHFQPDGCGWSTAEMGALFHRSDWDAGSPNWGLQAESLERGVPHSPVPVHCLEASCMWPHCACTAGQATTTGQNHGQLSRTVHWNPLHAPSACGPIGESRWEYALGTQPNAVNHLESTIRLFWWRAWPYRSFRYSLYRWVPPF